MTEEFRPTHSIRITFDTGVYGESDVHLVEDEKGNGPAYNRREWGTGKAKWEHRDGQWLFEGGTSVNGEEVQIQVKSYGSAPTSMELEGSPDEVLAKLQAIETLKQLMRTRPAVERDAVIDAAARAQVEKLAGRWRCVNNGWPPVIDTEMSIVDLERGIISDHVEAMGQTSERQIKIYEVIGSTLKVQTLDSQEISEWRLVSDDTIEMGVATRETVLVFNRQ